MITLRTICAVTTALTAMVAVGMLSGCKNTDTSEGLVAVSEVSQEDSRQSFTAKDILAQIDDPLLDGSAYFGDEIFEKNCEKLYGIPVSDIEDGGIIFASNGGNADEISMVKFKENDVGERILKERLDSRATTFETYKPEEMTKIDSAEIFQAGDYWVLVISDNVSELTEEIKNTTT